MSSVTMPPGNAGATATAATPAASSPEADVAAYPVRHRWLVMLAVMSASFIQFLDATIANVALPHMQAQLGGTPETITWVLTSFIIASAVATPITGWLADRIGARNHFLLAISGFIIASMLCGAANNVPTMVAFRILQGIFAAFIGPLSQTFMLDINRPSRQATAMAIWGMGVMVAPITGPTIGAWLTENLSWRWCFYINLPVGIITLGILWWLLPDRARVKRSFDVTGFALIAIGLGALQLLLDRGQGANWFESEEIIIEAIIAVSALWMMGVHIFSGKSTLFPQELIRNGNFLTGVGFMLILGVVTVAVMALLPPMMQTLLGYPVIETGYILASRGIGVMISMVIAARMIALVGPRWLIATGFLVCAFSMWLMSGWSLEVDTRTIFLTGVLQGMGMGLCFMPVNVLAFATIPMEHRTDGAGLLNLARSLGGSVGISIMTTLLARNIQISHADLAGHITPYTIPGADISALERLQGVGDAVMLGMDRVINQQAAMIAYVNDFWLMAIVIGLCAPLIFLAKEPRKNADAPLPPME